MASTFVKNAVLKGAKLIVADPRRHRLVDFADMHLQIKVGSDIALLNAIMYVLIQEGLYDKDFVRNNTTGFDELKAVVTNYPPETSWTSAVSTPTESAKSPVCWLR